MSDQKVREATIPGWDGPLFFKPVEKLHAEFAGLGYFNRQVFALLEEELETEARGRINVASSDKYVWAAGFLFDTEEGRIGVLFPCKEDREREDGTPTDRHVAVYTSGTVYGREVDEIVSRVFDKLRNVKRALETREGTALLSPMR